ncbi:MAG: 50S ribosomal protein L25, partial [Bacteroidota bacterium]
TCVLKDIVFDPITDRPTHFDLLGITANEKIRVEVPVSLQGQAIGMQHGGIVDFSLHKLEIECIPSEIPDHITVDITNLNVNDSIHVSDLNLPRITIISPAELNIVSISPSRVSEESTAAAAEPEVIAKGKTEDK